MDPEQEIKDLQAARENVPESRVPMTKDYTGAFDQELYGNVKKEDLNQYAFDDDDEEDDTTNYHPSTLSRMNKEKAMKELEEQENLRNSGLGIETKIDSDKHNEYRAQKQRLVLSPPRSDVFSGETPVRGYQTIMKEKLLQEEEAKVMKQIQEKEEQEQIKKIEESKKGKWDNMSSSSSKWDQATPSRSSFEATPSSSKWDQATPSAHTSKWDATPSLVGETPGAKRSRWDETPMTKGFSATPGASVLNSAYQNRTQQEMSWRNKPYSDEDLDRLLPPGYEIMEPPANYKCKNNHTANLFAAPTPTDIPGFVMNETPTREIYGMETPVVQDVPLYDVDQQFFGSLMTPVDEKTLTKEQARDRKIMVLLLRIKNGTPPQRKQALKNITEKATEFGADALFNQILPILYCSEIEGQERHLIVKVMDRVLFKLDSKVRPFTHKVLEVTGHMLIDSDRYARIEGREIISNLAKAVGLPQMISTLRNDLDSSDDNIRNITSRAFAVVASALGVQSICRFLKAVCISKKNWTTRHTGIKTVQQIAILMGISVLPHLNLLIDCIQGGLNDEEYKVRTITAQAVSALAEACYPYGYESFEPLLGDLLKGIKTLKGKCLAAYLNAIGFIIPLMPDEDANKFVNDLLPFLTRQFQTPDEEMKRIILRVIQHCVVTPGVRAQEIRDQIMPTFFSSFWSRRVGSEKRNTNQLILTTVEIAKRVGGAEVIRILYKNLKEENEPFRNVTLDTIQQIIGLLGTTDIDSRLEEQLIDGVLYAYQEQSPAVNPIMVKSIATILNGLDIRARPYLDQLIQILKYRFSNHNANVRMQAADIISNIVGIMKNCGEDDNIKLLGGVLYEYLGEEYPDVLGSILNALKSIVNVMGMKDMNPPIRDLLVHLTPILRNRHEKVQENCIDLVGRIADKGPDYVPSKEWARICYDLLEMLNAKKKSIRRATINTFGYIAQALGPSDVLFSLLNNLKAQERQNRVCTTIAIAVVADTCKPFTVIPALMNEYRTPEMNVQNGVLKSLAFMFEYIGELSKNYIYSLVTLFEDALTDRDMIHRQQASAALSHLFIGVYALGCEDAVQDLLNHVWPNIFEVSPHLNKAVFAAIEGARLSLGAAPILLYILQGLFHPARRVREVYWKLYNNLYVYAADGMTQAYPCLENDGNNHYERDYMDMFI